MPDATFQSDYLMHVVNYFINKWVAACKETAPFEHPFHAACDNLLLGMISLKDLFTHVPDGQANYAKTQLEQKQQEYVALLNDREAWRAQLLGKQAA